MKALTLDQPWASIVALGVKTIETRSWSTSYRGPLVIHAGIRPVRTMTVVGDFEAWPADKRGHPHPNHPDGRPARIYDNAQRGFGIASWWPLPFGAIVATCDLVDVLPIHEQGCKCRRVEGSLLLRWSSQFGEGAGLFDADGTGIDHPFWSPSHLDCLDRRNPRQQLPYGGYQCGRFAWLLNDTKPSSARCPACWGKGWHARGHYGPASTFYPVACAFCGSGDCGSVGHCDPIPAVGHQRLWEWRP